MATYGTPLTGGKKYKAAKTFTAYSFPAKQNGLSQVLKLTKGDIIYGRIRNFPADNTVMASYPVTAIMVVEGNKIYNIPISSVVVQMQENHIGSVRARTQLSDGGDGALVKLSGDALSNAVDDDRN